MRILAPAKFLYSFLIVLFALEVRPVKALELATLQIRH